MNQSIKESNFENYKKLLKKNGLKATPQRLAVHEAMLELGHASADMVTELVKKKNSAKVTVASVYNILTGLSSIGIYNYRLSGNNKMYFDVNTFKHLHLYDCENHTYKDVLDEELIAMIEKHFSEKKFRGYKIEKIDIQLIARPTKKKSQAVQH